MSQPVTNATNALETVDKQILELKAERTRLRLQEMHDKYSAKASIYSLMGLLAILPSYKGMPAWLTLSYHMRGVWWNGLPDDLPRELTTLEKQTLPAVLEKLMNKLQDPEDAAIWFFDDCIGEIQVKYQSAKRRVWVKEKVEVNNTYTFHLHPASSTGEPDSHTLYYVANGTFICPTIAYEKESLAKEFKYPKKSTDQIFNTLLFEVALKLRNRFLHQWCSVPHKKGMKLKTIAKQLFDHNPTKEHPSPQEAQTLCDALITQLDNYVEEQRIRKKNAPTLRRKHMQVNAYHNADAKETYGKTREEIFEPVVREEERLARMYEKCQAQLEKIERMKEQKEKTHAKTVLSLQNAQHARSSTLLLGVCKSLNTLYMTTKNIKLAENPFLNISNLTCGIAECLKTAPKNT